MPWARACRLPTSRLRRTVGASAKGQWRRHRLTTGVTIVRGGFHRALCLAAVEGGAEAGQSGGKRAPRPSHTARRAGRSSWTEAERAAQVTLAALTQGPVWKPRGRGHRAAPGPWRAGPAGDGLLGTGARPSFPAGGKCCFALIATTWTGHGAFQGVWEQEMDWLTFPF